MAKKPASVKTQKMVTDIVVHIFLAIVAIVWLIPFIWLVAHSFRGESTGQFTPGFFPTEFTFDNYIKLLKIAIIDICEGFQGFFFATFVVHVT